MASTVIFLDVLEWTWHYDPTLDSLVLVAHSSFRLYIFFNCPFSISVVSWHFDPCHSFTDLGLYLTRPPYFPEPTPFASSMETDPSEGSSPHSVLHVAKSNSSSSSTKVLPKMQLKEDPFEPVLENGFQTS